MPSHDPIVKDCRPTSAARAERSTMRGHSSIVNDCRPTSAARGERSSTSAHVPGQTRSLLTLGHRLKRRAARPGTRSRSPSRTLSRTLAPALTTSPSSRLARASSTTVRVFIKSHTRASGGGAVNTCRSDMFGSAVRLCARGPIVMVCEPDGILGEPALVIWGTKRKLLQREWHNGSRPCSM